MTFDLPQLHVIGVFAVHLLHGSSATTDPSCLYQFMTFATCIQSFVSLWHEGSLISQKRAGQVSFKASRFEMLFKRYGYGSASGPHTFLLQYIS